MNDLRLSQTAHPCFNPLASKNWGRIHLPVAPDCNISCNFCNRSYDCVNESRPGVTSRILTPASAATELKKILKQRSDLAVAGIAGPGDPFCNPELTLETLQLIHAAHPELLLCISSNGLNLPDYAAALKKTGVTHVTVTVNAVTPEIGRQIYAFARHKRKTYHGLEAAEILLAQQEESIRKLKEEAITVKVNVVVIRGINDADIVAIAKSAADWGADAFNCLPLIPVKETPFYNSSPPSELEILTLRKAAARHLPQISHCRRCRADAVGKLGEFTGAVCASTLK